MSRIRTIKPDFWSSPKVAAVPRETRLFFVGLWNEADDEGRLLASPKRLAGVLFPYDDDVTHDKVRGWLDDLERARLIRRYVVGGVEYALVVGLTEHQKIDKRYPSRLPAPAEQGESPADQSGGPAERGESPADQSGGPAERGESPADQSALYQVMEGKVEGGREAPTTTSLREKEIPIPKKYAGSGGVGGYEATFAKAAWAKTIPEVIARYGRSWAEEFAPLDGLSGRPTLERAIAGQWGWFKSTRQRFGDEPDAIAKLEEDLRKEAARYRRDWERDRRPSDNIDVDAIIGRNRGPP